MDALQTTVQLPQRLNLSIPGELKNSYAYSVNISPENLSSVTGGGGNFTSDTADAFYDIGLFTQQPVRFNIPCGESSQVFLDPQATSLSFRMTYTISTSASAATGTPLLSLISSAASWFDRLSITSSNLPLEEINYYSLVAHMMSQMTMSNSDRNGSLCTGCDGFNGSSGIDLPIVANGGIAYSFNFAIPLLSAIVGVNNDKLLPVGLLSNLVLELTTAQRVPMASYSGLTTPVQGVMTAITLTDFRLNLKYINLGQEGTNIFLSTLGADNKFFIKSSTYVHNSYTIPASSAGSVQIPIQIRNSSVKSIWNLFSTPISSKSPNGMFDSINIGMSSRQLVCGGKYFPSEVINDNKFPALSYYYTLQSFGRDLASSNGTGLNRGSFCALYSTVTGVDSSYIIPANCVRTYLSSTDGPVSVIRYPNSFITGFNCETLNGSLFSGINTRSVNPQLNLYLQANTAPAVNTVVNSFALIDSIIVIDVPSKSISTIV